MSIVSFKVKNIKNIKCPHCSTIVNTNPETYPGIVAYSWSIALLFLTGICCCVPFLVDGCKNVTQKCSNC